eukprot:7717184-Pyramimonas_sp.AAC.1
MTPTTIAIATGILTSTVQIHTTATVDIVMCITTSIAPTMPSTITTTTRTATTTTTTTTTATTATTVTPTTNY